MTHRKPSRFLAGAMALALVVSTLLTPLAAKAATLTISQDGPNLAVDTNLTVSTTNEWRLNSQATALANTNGSPANAGLVFGYVDPQNYYYANFAATTGAGVGGVYKITNGTRTAVTAFTTQIMPNQAYPMELRYKDNAIRVYLGTTFIYKVSNVAVAGTKLGVATEAGNATFTTTTYNVGSSTTELQLSLVGGGNPQPDPDPQPTPPVVQVTSPVAGATVSGTVALGAQASDTVGVTGVQFKVNGTNLGGVDTSAPYTASWDTTTVANGSHSVTAIATNQSGLTTTSAPVVVTTNNTTPTPPPTPNGFTIAETGPNAGIDLTRSTAGVSEWRLSSSVTPGAPSSTNPANFSLVFGYQDEQNFYYANLASRSKPGHSGVYRVTNGVAQKLVTYTTYISANQSTNLEVRYKDNAVRLYVNGTYLTKAEGINLGGHRAGVATLNAPAAFSNTAIKLGTPIYSLSLTTATLLSAAENPYTCVATPSTPVRQPSIGRQVQVSTSAELQAALLDAQPGDTITMADGVYTGTMMLGNYYAAFAWETDGTAENPITLTGSPNAIIDGDGTDGRYGLYLKGAHYWNLVGFTVTNASKGIMLDTSTHAFLDDMHVNSVGQEAIHFRAFSSDNVVTNSHISATGRASAQFGEGVYIGSANATNWQIHSGGLPDASSRNVVVSNTFTDFTAEAIDIKEGTSANYIAGNYFEGSSLSGENSADSWIDVKGRCNLVENNSGDNTLLDAYQVHNVFETWASYNVFKNNTANANSPGYGIAFDYNSLPLGNIVECNNVIVGAASGTSNVACTNEY